MKSDPLAGSSAMLLHNKVDKAVRLLAETSENQKKMNRVLQDLLKYGGIWKNENGEWITSNFPDFNDFAWV